MENPLNSTLIVRPFVMAAAAMCSSTEETRYYLCGVYAEPHNAGGVQLKATNGHMLLTIHDRWGFASGPARIWRHRELAPAINGRLKIAPKNLKATAHLRYESDGRNSKLGLGFGGLEDVQNADFGDKGLCESITTGVEIDGTYPDFRKVFPQFKPEDRSSACFQAGYIQEIGKIGAALGGTNGKPVSLLIPDHGGPSVFRIENLADGISAIGLIMPMRDDCGKLETVPDWVRNEGEAQSLDVAQAA